MIHQWFTSSIFAGSKAGGIYTKTPHQPQHKGAVVSNKGKIFFFFLRQGKVNLMPVSAGPPQPFLPQLLPNKHQ